MFEIPIKKYEEDIDAKISNEKKQEILELFTKSNKLRSKEEFDEIRDKLHEACKNGDIELIKIYLGETILNYSKELTFKLDETSKTASLFKVSQNIRQLFIPRTIQYESTEYLITSIIGTNSHIKTIKFSEDSAVKKIYSNAFSSSTIKEINFPASLRELEEDWCYETNDLTKITISPLNGQFMIKDDKYLIGKTDPNNEEFDILLFACRDIQEISIPSNIKIISSYAFENCNNLRKVEISPNSNLQIIGPHAFTDSNIESIFIPSTVSIICTEAFVRCYNMKKIEILPDSNLQKIEKFAFTESNIESIFIPSKVSKICEAAFFSCKNLSKVEIAPDSKLQEIESHIFLETNIESIFIPSNVSKLCENALAGCQNLKKVEIPPDSNLQTIEKCAFSYSPIKEIFFPANLRELNEDWCMDADELRKVIISPLNDRFMFKDDKYLVGKTDPNSEEFDIILFARRDIEEISIPSNIKIIPRLTFCRFINLKKVEISPNSNLQTIGSSAFFESSIEKISIPSKVSKICNDTFSGCKNLRKIEIPLDSNLQTIEKCAFMDSVIKEIYFPANLKELEKGWCCGTIKLKKIIISPLNNQFMFKDDKYLVGKTDPNSKEFDIFLFARRDIQEISIPSNIKIISSFAFNDCKNLRKVEIAPNSNLQTIKRCAFLYSSIESISIPSNVSKICNSAFNSCINLRKVEIAPNSNLQTIGSNAFLESNIESIIIPSKVSKICNDAFSRCKNLQIIEISEGSEIELDQIFSLRLYSKPLVMIPSYKK